mgnify:CR=1 FL=1
MEYLEKIYAKCKKDGHFTKFKSFIDFQHYFKDVETYKKLWSFLISKEYEIPEFEAFFQKLNADSEVVTTTQDQKTSDYNQPVASNGELIYNGGLKKLPDIFKIGNLKIDGFDYDLPAIIPFRNTTGIGYYAINEEQKSLAVRCIQVLAFRLLLSLPNRQSKIFIIDYEKSGSNFSALFGLDNKILEHEIWDDESEISNGITDLKNQIPLINSKILQNKYNSLAEYNEAAPYSNQPFQFLLIANFPKGFSKESAEKLLNIIQNGSKSGVYVLVSIDGHAKKTQEVDIESVINTIQLIDFSTNKIRNVENSEYFNSIFYLSGFYHELPSDIEKIKNQLNKDINELKAVSVDISDAISTEWNEDASGGIKVPIGIGENNEIFDFIFGLNSDSHHALIGGATGSGKTVLLHNIIIFSAYKYSPESMQMILLDYKEGTEFKCYENLPHTKILSIASVREFGLSVLEFLVQEITDRGILFKEVGAGNLQEYSQKKQAIIPRYLVIIDEFQVLLSGNDKISTQASELIQDICKRGRSFGVNMILSTQSLGDVDISSSTLTNIGLRIGLKMPEIDCTRILSIENDVPSRFTRPGEAVYNTQNGLKSGNKLFQSSYISKNELGQKISYLKSKQPESLFKQFIFDGFEQPDIKENLALQKIISENSFKINDNFCDVYIGEPCRLSEEHLKYRIRKQAESNFFTAGDDPQAVVACFYYSLWQIAKQSSAESQFYIFDLFDIDSEYSGQLNVLKNEIQNCKVFTKEKPLEEILSNLNILMGERANDENMAGRVVLAIMNVQKIRSLKKDGYNDSPLALLLTKILKEGPDVGIHSFMHFQNFNQYKELFDNNLLNEFENKLILKGEEINRYVDDYNAKNIKENGIAYFQSPQSGYEFSMIKVYKK